MAKLPVNFDAASVQPSQALDAFPAGWYNMHITGSEMKPTKAGDGAFLQLEHTILDGQFAGRKVYNNLNLQNSNAVAQQIAYETLSAICHAVGVIQVDDSSVLHGKPLQVKVKISPATKENDARNEVSGYKPIESSETTAAWTAPPMMEAAAVPCQAPIDTPAAPATPAPATPAPATPAPAKKIIKTMTNAAKGVTYEAYVEAKWTDKQMLDAGLLVITEEEVPAWSNNAPVQPSAPPAAPVAPTVTADVASPVKPPWEK